ncbi:ATPase [Desulfovibrio intestinalis]|uniref:Uncharacterized protein n=1 Tax=Desulfovibrio intestinalis TaxID=58621 RepID=A0A7W8C132_9BACT|nr:ATPase [Desulfovibrio intestinalis]MBB5142434.1 hypothetical protein [Desulfovibrio intestinalis]
MPHLSSNAASQPLAPSSQFQPDLELPRRIENFQKAAQDLLAMYEPAKEGQGMGGEIRCYYLPAGKVRHEQELLEKYHVEDFRGLLAETHLLLTGVVKVMRSTPHNMRMKGYVIASLGCLLEQASALVLRMRNVYGKMEKVG